MAAKYFDLTNKFAPVSALLLAAGVGYDSTNNRLVSLHGKDVLYVRQDPLSIHEYKEIVARAVLAGLPFDVIKQMPNLAAAIFCNDKAVVDNYHLMRMFGTSTDLHAIAQLRDGIIGKNQPQDGHFGRIAITAKSAGVFTLNVTCCRTRKVYGPNWKRWFNDRENARLDETFQNGYATAVSQCGEIKDSEPSDTGMLVLAHMKHPFVTVDETIDVDFLAVDFGADTTNTSFLIPEGDNKLDDAVVKHPDRLFITTSDTVYDEYFQALAIAQAEEEYKYHAIAVKPEEATFGKLAAILMSNKRGEDFTQHLSKANIVIPVTGIGMRLNAMSTAGFTISNEVFIACRLAERNRHTMIVQSGLISGWQLSPLENIATRFSADEFGVDFLIEGYSQERREDYDPELIATITSEIAKILELRGATVLAKHHGPDHLLRGVLPDLTTNVRHLISDVRDHLHNWAIANGQQAMIPSFGMTLIQSDCFARAIADENKHHITGHNATLNAMRRVFFVHDIPNMPGEAGDFFRKLEEIEDGDEAIAFVRAEAERRVNAQFAAKVMPIIEMAAADPEIQKLLDEHKAQLPKA